MAFISCTIDGNDQGANLRRLVLARWVVLAAMTGATVAAPAVLAIPLPTVPLLLLIALGIAFNGLAEWRLNAGAATGGPELFSQLAFDTVLLSALIFFSGGATNPLVSLLLPPVAIAALTLPARCVAAVGGLALGAYSLLMFFYIPLPLADAARATRLHLAGMWLTFAISATMIAWFVVRMTALIRHRDAQLATAREQALRDERVVALGTLAAGAAHELGTPLATIAVLVGELERDPGLSPGGREDLAVLRQQIGLCKEIITGLSRRAGAERLEQIRAIPVDRWLEEVRQRWHSLRPRAASRFSGVGTPPAPAIAADPRLEQAVLNLLNNAANASPKEIRLTANWDNRQLTVEIRDQGPGFAQAVLSQAGQAPFAPHDTGTGMGLFLTRSALESLGGTLELGNPPEGGALARICLPLPYQP